MDLKSFDPKLALARANGSQPLVDELHGLLIKDIRKQKDRLLQAAAREDVKTIEDIAHRLHGGSRYCGTPALEHATCALEKALLEKGSYQEAFDTTIAAIDALLLVEQS